MNLNIKKMNLSPVEKPRWGELGVMTVRRQEARWEMSLHTTSTIKKRWKQPQGIKHQGGLGQHMKRY